MTDVKDQLTEIGLTQSVFAEAAGVHEAEVSRHCRGLHVPARRVEQMAGMLNRIVNIVKNPKGGVVPNLRNAASIKSALDAHDEIIQFATQLQNHNDTTCQ